MIAHRRHQRLPRVRYRHAVALLVIAGMLTAVAILVGLSDGHDGSHVAEALRMPAAPAATFTPVHQPVAAKPTVPPPTLTERAAAATLAAERRWRQPISGPRNLAVPILIFHLVQPKRKRYFGSMRYDSVTPGLFAREVRFLSSRGFTAVTLQQVYDFWHGRGRLPRRPVVFTFDDGALSVFTQAAPILHRYGWPGVANIITADIGHRGRLTGAMIRTLIARGWEIDSHTVHHLDLACLSGHRLWYELAASRRRLHDLFGVPANFIAYPHGGFTAASLRAVRAAGYLGGTTVSLGLGQADEMFTLARINLNNPGAAALLSVASGQSSGPGS
ncbi:MAG: polysaccharide deacetylase family protein [Thermoleophilia bacterium]